MSFGKVEEKLARQLIGMAFEEDLGQTGDVTTNALIAADQVGAVRITARESGVLARLPVALMVFDEVDRQLAVSPQLTDGDWMVSGSTVAEISGAVRSLLVAERTCLNFLTHLSGIATLTRRYVNAVADSKA